ncbi:MAG: DUF6316 family protein [Kangiellaceae bacterium]|jgi:hypothetical protein|nr:DUF6316 family protein [Kangiellaceae bacterium]
MISRSSDTSSVAVTRQPRYTLLHDKWYFKTREERLLGPYDTVEEAENGVKYYIELVTTSASVASR